MIANITSKIYSTLGSNSSLVPLAIKDIANSMGLTAGSYITGKDVEGKDRFIDEFGTQAIWLGGIPFYKKAADLTLYKLFKIDPKFDPRNLTSLKNMKKEDAEEFIKTLLEKTPEHLKKNVKKAIDNPKLVKNLSLIKFGISTALAIATYMGLTKYRQHFRMAEEIQQLKEEQAKTAKNMPKQELKIPQAFEGVHGKKNKNVAFTGGLQDFMFNPVKNLMLLDGAITEERLRSSESKQEFINYSIKEGGTWTFMYFAGPLFQKFFEKHAKDKAGNPLPINLDSRIIESKELHQSLGSGTLKQSIEDFNTKCANASDVDIYKFIHNNQDNEIVKMAKKADIIKMDKKSQQIDTRAFIDIKDFKDLKDRLAKILEASENAVSKAVKSDDKVDALDKFMKEIKHAKRMAIFKNMGICISALGIGVPLMMIASRFIIPNNREYKVKEAAAQKLAKENNFVA